MDSNGLRDKLMDAYHKLSEGQVYINSTSPFSVFVKRNGDIVKEHYETASLLGVATAITPLGSILYWGGHGCGKTSVAEALGIMIGGVPKEDIEYSVLRMNPELTEEKIVARPEIGKLLTEGTEEYKLRKFIESPWKIGDEFNRASPEVADIFFSGIENGIWKYADLAYKSENQRFFGTINPEGEGTFNIDPAMYDRFGVCVPVKPAAIADLSEIGDRKDAVLYGFELESIMTQEELIEATRQADEIKVDDDAKILMSYFEKDLSLCDKAGGDKADSVMKPSDGLCSRCHYATTVRQSAAGIKNPCQMTDGHVSTRTHEKWERIAKRVGYLLDQETVSSEMIGSLAPYIMYHRVRPNDNVFRKDPYNGNRIALIKDAWKLSKGRLDDREEAEIAFLRIIDGKGSEGDIDKLRQMNDLVVKYDMLPYVEHMDKTNFKEMVADINKADAEALPGFMKSIRNYSQLPIGAQNQLRALVRARRAELNGDE